MNDALYNDWAHKRMTAMDFKMNKIRKKRKKRTDMMIKFLVPFSVSFLVIGAFTFGQFFQLAYMICSFIIVIVFSVLIYLDDKDNKKFLKMLESWGDTTDVRFLPPSIRDTFNS